MSTPRPPKLPHSPQTPLPPHPGTPTPSPQKPASSTGKWVLIAALVLLFAAIVALGVHFYLKNRNSYDSDYYRDSDSVACMDSTSWEFPAEEFPIEMPAADTDAAYAEAAPVVVYEEEVKAESAREWLSMFDQGMNTVEGNMYVGGETWPFKVTFYCNKNTGELSNIKYYNISQATTITMHHVPTYGEEVVMKGKDGSADFTLRFSYDGEGTASGTATLGHRTVPISVDVY